MRIGMTAGMLMAAAALAGCQSQREPVQPVAARPAAVISGASCQSLVAERQTADAELSRRKADLERKKTVTPMDVLFFELTLIRQVEKGTENAIADLSARRDAIDQELARRKCGTQ